MEKKTYAVSIRMNFVDGELPRPATIMRKCESESPAAAIIETLSSIGPDADKYYTALTTAYNMCINCDLVEGKYVED